MHNKQPIVPRTKLDFDLQGDIPKYWFGGDPFKTRFFDALSTIFPEGERFFINCVRDFRDQITDPVLQQEVKDFIRQEGQHGMVHDQFNNRLRAQGIDVDAIERFERKFFDGFMRRWIPKKHTLALTAASEHMTAIMAHVPALLRSMFQRSNTGSVRLRRRGRTCSMVWITAPYPFSVASQRSAHCSDVRMGLSTTKSFSMRSA